MRASGVSLLEPRSPFGVKISNVAALMKPAEELNWMCRGMKPMAASVAT